MGIASDDDVVGRRRAEGIADDDTGPVDSPDGGLARVDEAQELVAAPQVGGVADRLDEFQRHHRWLGFPLAVIYKFVDDQGIYLAVLITYYGFLSLFPLLLLLASIVGFLLENNPDLQREILTSTVSQFPILREQLADPEGLRGSTPAVIVGGAVAIYGALGVAHALQNAMNIAWAVPRNRRPNPIVVRLRSMLLMLTTGIAVLATTVLSGVVSSADAWGAEVSTGVSVLATVVAILINAFVFVLVFRIATARPLALREVILGAIVAAVIWQLLQLFGTAYVSYFVKDVSSAYGVFALVFGLFAWIFLGAVGLVLCVELNVVRVKHLYPRALLTPFTDNVDLTAADKRAYADAAAAQRLKEFQRIDVHFGDDGQHLSATRRGRDEGDADDDPAR